METYELLEKKLADWCECPNIVVCSSGTAALHLALEAFELEPHRGVIVPEFTMIACPRACTLADLTPTFADCDDALLITLEEVNRILLQRPLAQRGPSCIMPVHVYGRRVDMWGIDSIADANNLLVVEDMAEAHGIKPHPNTDAACWSFYRNKIVAGEEGGAIAFRERKHADVARSLRSLGFNDDHNFVHRPRGHNYRMSNCHAELILKSLAKVKENLQKRREVEDLYDAYIPAEWKMPPREVCWVYDIRIPISLDVAIPNIDTLVAELNKKAVAARCGFKPMSSQPEYVNVNARDLNAYRLSQEVLYLPIRPEMQRRDVAQNVYTLQKLMGV